MSQKVNFGNKRTKSRSATVSTEWIAGDCVVSAAIITAAAAPLPSGDNSEQNPSPSSTLAEVAALPATSASEYGFDVEGQ
jgi:hypothetical protein